MKTRLTRTQNFASYDLSSRANFLQLNLARVSIALLASFFLLIMAAHPSSAQQPQQQLSNKEDGAPATTGGSITGRVVDEARQPMASAVVYVNTVGGQKVSRNVGTDSDGNFQVRGLEEAAYRVRAYVPGYVVAPPVAPTTSARGYYRVGDSVTLTLSKGGVITGTVTNSAGEPVIAAPVVAARVRDAEGHTLRVFYNVRPRFTDDRGVYRLYGLEAGAYVVSVGGRGQPFYGFGLYDNDAPTYAPSSTRDTAAEIVVRSGEEARGIDIRYRGEPGHAVSGKVNGALNTSSPTVGTSITLTRAVSGAVEAVTYSSPRLADRPFAFYGVPDGEYELTAQVMQFGVNALKEGAASSPHRVTVKGANVTGVELTLAPLASINGRTVLEPSRLEACAGQTQDTAPPTAAPQGTPHDARLRESVIIIRRDDQDLSKDQTPPPSLASNTDAVPDEQGAFAFRNLNAGRYHLEVRLAGENWYVRTLTMPAGTLPAATPRAAPTVNARTPPATAAKAAPVIESSDAARNTLNIKQGERVRGLTIIIAEGAASLRGRIKPEADGAHLNNNLRAYLVPAEREAAEDVFRYAETNVNADGTYAFNNIPPGHYYFITQTRPPNETLEVSTRPLAWNATQHARLRLAAETANDTIELRPCQREERQ